MIVNNLGEIVPGFHALGASSVPTYLLDAEVPVLFDAGFSSFGPIYEQGVREILGTREPAILFLTHVHFDHCGAAAYLKDAFKGMKIAASKKAAEIVQRPNALKLIKKLNEEAKLAARRYVPECVSDELFEPFDVDLVLRDGEVIDLGNMSVKVIYSPGHTWDMLSYYIPEKKILIASEAAGGTDLTGGIITEFIVDFDRYIASLQSLAKLEVDVLLISHIFAYTRAEAREFLDRSVKAAFDFRELVVRLLNEENGDVARVVQLVKKQEYDPRPIPKQPEPAYLLNLEARVRWFAQALPQDKRKGENRGV